MTGVALVRPPPSCSGPSDRETEPDTSRLLRRIRQEVGRRGAIGSGGSARSLPSVRSRVRPGRTSTSAPRTRRTGADAAGSGGARKTTDPRLDHGPSLPLPPLHGGTGRDPPRRAPETALHGSGDRPGARAVGSGRGPFASRPRGSQPLLDRWPRRATRVEFAAPLGRDARLTVAGPLESDQHTSAGPRHRAAPRRTRTRARTTDRPGLRSRRQDDAHRP